MVSSTALKQTALVPPNNTGRLRYADSKDLPSCPSSGLKDNNGAASAAATLGWTNRKSVEYPKPEISTAPASSAATLGWTNTKVVEHPKAELSKTHASHANTAAVLANGQKMASPTSNGLEVSRTKSNAAGSQAAISALRAAQRQQKQQHQPQPQQPKLTLQTSNWGNSAANLAFKGHKSPTSSTLTVPETHSSALTRQASLRAARDAVAGRRPRSKSQPQPITDNTAYPDKENATSNALSAAAKSMRSPSIRSTDGAGAVPYTTMSREMFTSRPPVKPEVDEKQRQDVLHASALAMAKRMYTQQQKTIDQSKQAQGRRSSFERHGTSNPTDQNDEVERSPVVYNSLQDAAYRLAQERLAKLHDEHQKNREMQEYYTGASPSSNQGNSAGSAFGSIRNKLTRRRSSSDGDIIAANDRQHSQRIRKQMSLFNTKIAEVDEQKRARDREALLQAAQRNVKARLQGMDEKLYAEKGVMIPHTSKSDWEVKAHAAAQARFDATNSGKRSMDAGQVDIGGGKMVDRAKVEDIAAKRVQPLLDEINDLAEKERERKATLKMEEERKKEEVEKNKMREKEVAMLHKQLKDQQKDKEKALAAEVKREERQRKEEEKAAKAEQKRLAKEAKETKEEKQTGKGKEPATVADLDRSSPDNQPMVRPPVVHRRTDSSGLARLSMPFLQRRTSPLQRVSTSPDEGTSPISDPQSVASPTSKVKAWLKSRFSRPRRVSGASVASPKVVTTADGTADAASPNANRGFIGGMALTRKLGENNPSVPSIVGDDHSGPGSIREVALAGLSAPSPVQASATLAPAITLRATAQDEPGESSGLTTVPNNPTGALGTAALKSSSRPISAIGSLDALATVTTITTTTTTTKPAVRDRPPSPSAQDQGQVQQPHLVLPYVTTTTTTTAPAGGEAEVNSVSSLSSSDLSDSVYSSVSNNSASRPAQDNDNDNEDDEFLEARSIFSSDGPHTPPSAGFPPVVNGMQVSVTQPTPSIGSEGHGQFLMVKPRASTGSGFGVGSVSGRSLRERPVSPGGLSVGQSSISGCGRISPFRESRFSENFDKED
ncbi:uncharacterized protein B0T23DRAFT_10308 [Neurospora hispaniola]|uniref:Eisosome protein 1 n=1 Tax=Neurospora hispaniola TaxID=588809 RepID=A0AAJ0IF39_9PEZI|nr:hypothetical protein B0T23DRAFT_10308 [Neurospora hispaniola]